MGKVTPIHSIEPSATVYHDESTCTERNNIEDRYRRQGTAGRPKCDHCQVISG